MNARDKDDSEFGESRLERVKQWLHAALIVIDAALALLTYFLYGRTILQTVSKCMASDKEFLGCIHDPALHEVAKSATIAILILGLFLVTVLIAALELLRRNRLNRVLRINPNLEVFIVLSAIPYNRANGDPVVPRLDNKHFSEGFRWTTPYDGVEGAVALVDLLELAGVSRKRVKICFSLDQKSWHWNANLFFIGGHEHNQAVAKLNKEGQKKHRKFQLLDNKILVYRAPDYHSVEREYVTEIDDQGKPQRDHCLVTRRANPLTTDGDSAVVWTFEGVRHWGTLAGLSYVYSTRRIRRFRAIRRSCKAICKNNELQLVVSCEIDVELDYFGRTQVVRCHEGPCLTP